MTNYKKDQSPDHSVRFEEHSVRFEEHSVRFEEHSCTTLKLILLGVNVFFIIICVVLQGKTSTNTMLLVDELGKRKETELIIKI